MCLARRVEIMEEMKSSQGSGKIIPAFVDVISAKPSDWDAVIKNFVGEYGKISGGVYTAGIGGNTAFRNWNEDFAQRIMDTSYWGMLRFAQSASKKKFSFGGASFVVFSSIAAHLGECGQFIYAGVKSAVIASVKVIAKEIAKNFQRINSISPGWVNTEINKSLSSLEFGVMERRKAKFWLGEAEADRVSGMVLFLLSDRADWITGTDIIVDGGQILGAE